MLLVASLSGVPFIVSPDRLGLTNISALQARSLVPPSPSNRLRLRLRLPCLALRQPTVPAPGTYTQAYVSAHGKIARLGKLLRGLCSSSMSALASPAPCGSIRSALPRYAYRDAPMRLGRTAHSFLKRMPC